MSSRTPNINLEKPSSDENYSISVFNGNSDTIDTEMALRVKTADIINNLTSTATNKPLSAAQGKSLSDTIATLLSRFQEKIAYVTTFQSDNDLNKLIKTGMYQTNGTISTPTAPFSNPALVLVIAGGSSSDYRILQIITRSNTIADESVYYRKCYGDPTITSNWLEWQKLATDATIAENNFFNRGTALTSGADLNTVTTVGDYYSPNSATTNSLVNCPLTGSGFVLKVMQNSNNSYPVQMILDVGGGFFTRAGTSGGWSDWRYHATKAYVDEQLATKVNYYDIAQGADIDTLLLTGIYRSPSTTSGVGTLLHRPENTTNPFTMIVTGNSNGALVGCVQTIITNGVIYTRRATSGSFIAWTKFTGTTI